MPLLTLSAVSFAYAFEPILDDVSFTVEPGQRIALVGRNGAGKTTLLNIVAGRIEPDSGTRSIAKTARIGVLDQHPTLDPDETLRGEAEDVAPMVAWLASDEAAHVNGHVFHVTEGLITLLNEPEAVKTIQKDGMWTVEELVRVFPVTIGLELLNPAPSQVQKE